MLLTLSMYQSENFQQGEERASCDPSGLIIWHDMILLDALTATFFDKRVIIMKEWLLCYGLTLCCFTMYAGEEKSCSAQGSLWQRVASGLRKSSAPKDDSLNCFYQFPHVIQKLIAEYCIGTKNNMCPLLVRALARQRVITHSAADLGSLHLNMLDEDPYHMTLRRDGRDITVFDSFNFATGERTLKDYEYDRSSGSFDQVITFYDRNKFISLSIGREDPIQTFIGRRDVHLMPPFQVESPYEGLISRAVVEEGYRGLHYDHSRIALLCCTALGRLNWHWIGVDPEKGGVFELHPSSPLDVERNSQLLFSEDYQRVGAIVRGSIVAFHGITGKELGRWLPPDNYQLMRYRITKRLAIGEEAAHYEIVALVKKGRLKTTHRYMCWDIDHHVVQQSTLIREGRLSRLYRGAFLHTGQYISVYDHFSSQKLISCRTHNHVSTKNNTADLLWDAGSWRISHDHDGSVAVSATSSGSHVAILGRSENPIIKKSALYKIFVTMLHFDPHFLYTSDVADVTGASLLERVRLLNGLCVTCHQDKEITLTPKGKHLFEQFHSVIRVNLQTTMLRVHGWDIEDMARKCTVPIFVSGDRKSSEDKECKVWKAYST